MSGVAYCLDRLKGRGDWRSIVQRVEFGTVPREVMTTNLDTLPFDTIVCEVVVFESRNEANAGFSCDRRKLGILRSGRALVG